MLTPTLSDIEFGLLRDWVYARAGIAMSDAKKHLMVGRLQKRLLHHGLRSYAAYHQMISSGHALDESQMALDLLTTNETSFFREPKHFDFLHTRVLPERRAGSPLRVWSAACSSGEEPWSIATVRAEKIADGRWEILASDLSSRVLAQAQAGQYAMERADHIPRALLTKYCLRGVGSQDGTFRIGPQLRRRLSFRQVNLIEKLPDVGVFDLIVLRNVLIYFDADTKAAVVRRLCANLRPGGYFFCGHSESLHGMELPFEAVQPAVYRKR